MNHYPLHTNIDYANESEHKQIFVDLEANIITAKKLGYEGMLALNPKELQLVHSYFSPSEAEADMANETLGLAEKTYANNQGVAISNGKFIGPPMII